MKKLNVVVFFGGKSEEHPISIQSAQSVVQNLDVNKYNVFLIGIDKNGSWYHIADTSSFLKAKQGLSFDQIGKPVILFSKNEIAYLSYLNENKSVISNDKDPLQINVAFPVLHGPYGEDGSFQGLLKCSNLPFVGPDVLSSAICMDKIFTKKLLLNAHIPTARFVEVSALKKAAHYYQKEQILEQVKSLGFPVFVKPANMGSSIGIQKIKDDAFLKQAIEEALKYDKKAIVEECIEGREIEVAILGNEEPKASLPGEIVPHHEFYSYKAKYLDPQGALLKISNLNLSDTQIRNIQEMAKKVFLLLECRGMARVDFFLKSSGEVLVNEVNTIPGFTSISMYPKLWQATGLSYSALLDKLIELALESS